MKGSHRSRFAIAISAALLLAMATVAEAVPVTIEWDPNLDGVTEGYRLFYGTSSGNYDLTPPGGLQLVGIANTSHVADLTPGQLYFIMIRGYNSIGVGPPSPELSYVRYTDSVLTAGVTEIKRVHITELRTSVDAVRTALALLGPFPWTDATLTAQSSQIRVQHITDLRIALTLAYTAMSRTPPTFTDPVLTQVTAVKRLHVEEIRAAVIALITP